MTGFAGGGGGGAIPADVITGTLTAPFIPVASGAHTLVNGSLTDDGANNITSGVNANLVIAAANGATNPGYSATLRGGDSSALGSSGGNAILQSGAGQALPGDFIFRRGTSGIDLTWNLFNVSASKSWTMPNRNETFTAPTTDDANADVMWGASATGKKALVLQAKASQTVNTQEWQTSSGIATFAVPAVPSGATGTQNTVAGSGAGIALTTGDGNVFLGYQAGAASTTNLQSVHIGTQAGMSITTASDIGLNVFVGYQAGKLCVIGEGHTFIGGLAGYSCTATNDNTFTGCASGYSCTTGQSNAYYGEQSGYNNQTGEFNTALGRESGWSHTGSYSVYVGAAAGYSATTGINVFIGYHAGRTVIGGTQNVYIGRGSGETVDGSDNVLLGADACSTAADFSSSVVIGSQAGLNITGGGDYVIIGMNAGQHVNAAHATFVGFQAGQANTTGASNCFIGQYCGFSNVDGSDNTGCGSGALGFIGTGANGNTGVGSQAGATVTTGDDNVFLGKAADGNATGTSSAIVIGSGTSGASTSVIITKGVASSVVNDLILASGDTGIARSAAGITKFTAGSGAGNGGFLSQLGSSIVGHADEVQLTIKANGTQANPELSIQTSAAGRLADLGRLIGQTTYGALYLGASTPTTTNYCVTSNGSTGTYVNAASGSNVVLSIGGTGSGAYWTGTYFVPDVAGGSGLGGGTGGLKVVGTQSDTVGSLIMGNSTLGAIGTNGTGVLAIANGVAPTTSPANEVQLYAKATATNNSNLYCRNEAGVLKQLSGLGPTRLTADVANNTTTFSNLSDLTLNIEAGRKYVGTMVIKCNNSTAAEGIKFDFNGGTATMTAFWAAATESVGGTTVLGTAISTALNGVINYTTITGETIIVFYVSFVVNAAGTIIPRVAENSSSLGTVTAELGSFWDMQDSAN